MLISAVLGIELLLRSSLVSSLSYVMVQVTVVFMLLRFNLMVLGIKLLLSLCGICVPFFRFSISYQLIGKPIISLRF